MDENSEQGTRGRLALTCQSMYINSLSPCTHFDTRVMLENKTLEDEVMMYLFGFQYISYYSKDA